MYLGWAARRGMRAGQPAGAGGVILAISGLGARRILGDEAGLHLLELPGEQRPERPADRIAVAVQVAPWPLGLALEEPGAAERVAAELARAPAPTRIVRRYRRDPTPLVRDAVRGFRTGRLDRVLAGDFDVL